MTKARDCGKQDAPRSLVLLVVMFLTWAFPTPGQASPIKHAPSYSPSLNNPQSWLPNTQQLDQWWHSIVSGSKHWYSSLTRDVSSAANTSSASSQLASNPRLMDELQRMRTHHSTLFNARHPRLAALLDQSQMQGSLQAQTLQPSTVSQVASSRMSLAAGSASRAPVLEAELLATPIPEPGTWVMGCVLIGAAAWWGRRAASRK
jgi:hypothetical protein